MKQAKDHGFPIEKVGRFRSLMVKNPSGETIEINHADLKLTYFYGQIAWYYNGEKGEFYLPICRLSSLLNKLIHRNIEIEV